MKTEKYVLYWGLWRRNGGLTFSHREIIRKKDHSVSNFQEWLKARESEMEYNNESLILLKFKIVEDK